GRTAVWPSQIPLKGWKDIFWRLVFSFFGDRLPSVAGGIAFFLLLSIFPGIAAFVSLYGLFADVGVVGEQLQSMRGVLPPDVLTIIGEQMTRIAGAEKGGLGLAFFGSLLVALWSAMTGVKALFQGLNVAYHETERRNLLKVNLTALWFTVGLFLFSGVVIGAVIVTPAVLGFWGYNSEQGVGLLRWPILLVANVAVLSVLYRYGPSRELPRWRWVTWGGVISSFLWLAASWGFSWYLANMANYQATYGSLGAFMGFMVWTWLSVLVVLIGAEVNAEMEHQTVRDTTTGAERPLGERGAVVADTIGPRKGVPGAQFTQAAREELAKRAELRRSKKKLAAAKADEGPRGDEPN
ncbi:MAG TPA: YihY/virulence factor BrkB family protein, partial [Caulobacteraceae bacterium]